MIELSEETEALAYRLATEQELPVDEAVRQALEASAISTRLSGPSQVTSAEIIASRREAIDDMVAKIAAAPVLDPRSSREIMDDLDPL